MWSLRDLVGSSGFDPAGTNCEIVLPAAIAAALAA